MSEALPEPSLDFTPQDFSTETKSTYERVMGQAALAETLGRIADMRRLLNAVRLSGNEESTRLLYLAIAEEKTGDPEAALRLLFRVMESTEDPLIWKAAQFNARVCHEKLDDFDRADFMPFVRDRGLFMLGEPVWLKAVSMELIACTRSGRRCQIQVSEIEDALTAELTSAPGGYVKTLVNWAHYRNLALTEHELGVIHELTSRTRANVRAGLLFELWATADDLDLKRIARESIEVLARETQDPTVARYLEKF